MTIKRLKEKRSMMTSYPNGWGFVDPTAVPPPGNFQAQRAGVLVTPHTTLQLGVVNRCIAVISNSIIQAGNPVAYRVSLDKDSRPFKSYLPAQPSILTNTWGPAAQTEGMSQTIISLCLFGEAFWLTTSRDFYQFPASICPLNPMLMQVKTEDDGDHFYYGTGRNRVELPAEDITHIKGMTMPGAKRALSPVEYESTSFALALAAIDFGSKWFAQGASPSFLLSTEQRIGRDEIKRIAEQFLVEHSGLQSAHLPLVLDSGLKVEKLGATADEAGFIGTLEYARQEIAGYFGVPPHLIGSTGDQGGTWGKGVEEANFSFVDFTLSGYTSRLNEAFSSLLPRGQFAFIDLSSLQRANALDTSHIIQQLRLGTVMTINEIRRDYYSLPPIAGGDNLDAPLASNVAPVDPAAKSGTVEDGTNPSSASADDSSSTSTSSEGDS